MKFIKILLVLMTVLSVTVCSAEENKVICDVSQNEKVFSINVLSDESGESMSESDIIIYLKDTVNQCRTAGAEQVIVKITAGLADAENIAGIIDGIDVLCVTKSDTLKADCVIGGTAVIYISDGALDFVQDTADVIENKKSPNETLNSMVLMCFVLIAVALIVLLAVKKKFKK